MINTILFSTLNILWGLFSLLDGPFEKRMGRFKDFLPLREKATKKALPPNTNMTLKLRITDKSKK